MNIVCTFDDNYLRHAAAMLTSLKNHHSDEEIRVWAIHNGKANKEAGKLYSYLSELFTYVTLSRFDTASLNVLPTQGHCTTATYLRLALDKLLPSGVSRILYLDPDILVNGNLAELYATNIDNYTIAACLNHNQDDGWRRLGLPAGTPYFNAGVMLINVNEWRQKDVLSTGMAFAELHPDRISFADQDVLNYLFHEAWLQLEHRWNYQTPRCLDEHYGQGAKAMPSSTPSIVHFTGPAHSKPWHVNCVNPYGNAFREAANATPWARTPLTGGPLTLTLRTKSLLKQAFGSFRSAFANLGSG